MQVVNLVSWAGENFSYAPGEVIELPDEVAEARKLAGLAEDPPAAAAGRGKPKQQGGAG